MTSHDGDVESPGFKGRDLQMPEAVEGDQETGIQLSCVLPEASGGATVRDRQLDNMGPWPDPEGLLIC